MRGRSIMRANHSSFDGRNHHFAVECLPFDADFHTGENFTIMGKKFKYVLLSLLILLPLPGHAQTVDEILGRMLARNEWQDRALLEFQARRKFYAANIRFKT